MGFIEIHIASKDFLERSISEELVQLPMAVNNQLGQINSEYKRTESFLAYQFLFKLFNRMGLTQEDINWKIGEKGKPGIDQIQFNITHSKEFIGIIISNQPVGIDIQEIKKVNEGLVKRVSNSKEFELYKEGDVSFFQLWSRKEAVVKMTGEGLSVGINNIEVIDYSGQYNNQGYYWRDIHVCQNYQCSFAVRKSAPWTVRYY